MVGSRIEVPGARCPVPGARRRDQVASHIVYRVYRAGSTEWALMSTAGTRLDTEASIRYSVMAGASRSLWRCSYREAAPSIQDHDSYSSTGPTRSAPSIQRGSSRSASP